MSNTRSALFAAALAFSGILTAQQVSYTLVTAGLNTVSYELGPSEIEIADMNNDGRIDILSLGDHGSPNIGGTEAGIMVWLNNGTGTNWTLKKTGNFGYGGIAVGDVNNDGQMDVGYGMHHNYSNMDFGDQLIEVALGNGTAQTWTPYDDGLATNGETYGMFGVDFADVNNDGLLDIGANSFGCCSGIHVYKNNGNGTWTQTDGANAGNAKHHFKFGDLNNDGNVDCVVANEIGVIFSNNGTGYFTSMENGFPQDWYIEYDLDDVNNDGAKDIAVVTNNQLLVYTYNTSLNTWQSISNGLPTSTLFEAVNIDDFDMDGNKDLVAWASGSLTIFKGDGNGNWTQDQVITIPETQFSSMNTGDFNHDGYADIVYLAKTSSQDNILKVYLSTPNNPSLNLVPSFPRGNECFAPNSVQFLTWNSSVPTSTTATVTIEFSQSGPSGPYTTIVNNYPNAGMYQWTTPTISSSNCYLRYTINNGNNTVTVVTSSPFGVGSCNLSTGTEVAAHDDLSDLIVFPNPVKDAGYLQFTVASMTRAEVTIVDVLGNRIRQVLSGEVEAGAQKHYFDASDLAPGVYFCEVLADGQKHTVKFVVIK